MSYKQPSNKTKSKNWAIKGYMPFVALFLIIASLAIAAPPPANRPTKEGAKKIILDYSNVLEYDGTLAPGVQKLIGNVQLRHQNWIMNCDSAHLNEQENQFEAFGTVKITEGDSISIFSKYLFYDGNTRFAKLRNTVELHNNTAVLYTDSLDYDRNLGIGYYFETGTIVDSLNVLTSIYGEYSPNKDEAIFRNMVELQNPDFSLKTDFLRYNTRSKIAYYDGPTLIETDSGHIETLRGVYDTDKDVGILLDRSIVYNQQGTIMGDSMLYDRKNKFAESFGSMELVDTVNKAILKGEYGYYDEAKEYAFAAHRASLTDYSQTDTLWIGADTMELISQKKDEEEIRLSRASHRVRLFRKDVQATADSLQYFSLDSALTLYQSPILWQDSIQMEGDTIRLFFAADTLDRSVAWPNAKVMRLLEEEKYEQMKGDSLLTFFADSTVREVRAIGNVEMIYYALQEALHRYYAIGHIKAPELVSYIDGDTLRKTMWIGATEGKIYPIEKVTPDLSLLSGLEWKPKGRPQSPLDIHPREIDSLGNEIPYTPLSKSDLNRFSGALAAITAYELLQHEIDIREKEKTIDNGDETIPDEEQNEQEIPLSPYILRPNEETPEWESPSWEDIFSNNPLKEIWDSFSSTATKELENSSTLLSTGIPRRRPETNE